MLQRMLWREWRIKIILLVLPQNKRQANFHAYTCRYLRVRHTYAAMRTSLIHNTPLQSCFLCLCCKVCRYLKFLVRIFRCVLHRIFPPCNKRRHFSSFFLYSLALLSWDAINTSLDCHCALESAIKDTFIGPEIFCNNNCLHDASSSSVSTIRKSNFNQSVIPDLAAANTPRDVINSWLVCFFHNSDKNLS